MSVVFHEPHLERVTDKAAEEPVRDFLENAGLVHHKGHFGDVRIDQDAGVIRGRVVGLKDVITFQGSTVEGARGAFVDSVEGYLAFCNAGGEKPETPYSGKLLVRLDPKLHLDCTGTSGE